MIANDNRRGDESGSEQSHKKMRRIVRLLRRSLPYAATSLVVLAAVFLYGRFAPAPELLSLADVETKVNEVLAEATPVPEHSVAIYDAILPSLVVIEIGNAGPSGDGFTHSIRPELPDVVSNVAFPVTAGEMSWSPAAHVRAAPVQQRSPIGSGVLVNDSGTILTAFHVVEGASLIRITFADGTETTASVVAVVPDNNIAVLQAEQLPEVFAPATLGNPGSLRIGDDVYAVGNPLGLAASISAGIVSGLDRTYQHFSGAPPLERLIQFDSAVNAGSAGGPLLNRNAEVVGIVVGPVNPTAQETFIGIGFAVRIDVAGSAAGAPEL